MKEERIVLRITAALKDVATREAERRGLTLSDWVRGVITEATGGPLLPRHRRGSRPARKGKKLR